MDKISNLEQLKFLELIRTMFMELKYNHQYVKPDPDIIPKVELLQEIINKIESEGE